MCMFVLRRPAEGQCLANRGNPEYTDLQSWHLLSNKSAEFSRVPPLPDAQSPHRCGLPSPPAQCRRARAFVPLGGRQMKLVHSGLQGQVAYIGRIDTGSRHDYQRFAGASRMVCHHGLHTGYRLTAFPGSRTPAGGQHAVVPQ